jgi:phosphohistidine phosphatase
MTTRRPAPTGAAKPAVPAPAGAAKPAAKPKPTRPTATDAAPARRSRAAAPKPAPVAAPPAETEPDDHAHADAPATSPALIQLYFIRHADAGDSATWPGDDAERPLSAKGRRQARRLGKLLDELDWRPHVILTSPLLRAAETARLIARSLEITPINEPRLGGPFAIADIAEMLAEHEAARRVVLVGHDPWFSTVTSDLVGGTLEVRKGALVRIDLVAGDVRAGSGALRWLLPPGAVPG